MLKTKTMKTFRINLLVLLIIGSILPAQAQFSMDRFKQKVKNRTSSAQSSTNSKNNQRMNATVTSNQTGQTSTEESRHFYVSRNTGRGRVASKDKPAKDLGNIIAMLKAGDVIHIAEGVYTSRGDRSADWIQVPVSIIGGYSADFSKRDPWGAHKTVFSGVRTLNAETNERLKIETNKKFRDYKGKIVIDGIIVDNGDRNRYRDEKELLIIRKADMVNGINPTPRTAGIKVIAGKNTNITIRNCIVTNVAPSQGALSVQANQNAEVLIENNIVANNTGNGIQCLTNWHSDNGRPKFKVLNNTVLFSWKFDAIASYGGNGLAMDRFVEMHAENNVFGFGDFGGVDNEKRCEKITLINNLFTGNKKFDYRESVSMALEDMEDESDYLSYESVDNVRETVKLPVNQKWAEVYAGRVEINRAMVDAEATAIKSDANELRSMLGLPLRGNTVKIDAEVWLHRLPLADVLKAGMQQYKGKYGSSNPGQM